MRDIRSDLCENGDTNKDGPERRANAVIPGPCRLSRSRLMPHSHTPALALSAGR